MYKQPRNQIKKLHKTKQQQQPKIIATTLSSSEIEMRKKNLVYINMATSFIEIFIFYFYIFNNN